MCECVRVNNISGVSAEKRNMQDNEIEEQKQKKEKEGKIISGQKRKKISIFGSVGGLEKERKKVKINIITYYNLFG